MAARCAVCGKGPQTGFTVGRRGFALCAQVVSVRIVPMGGGFGSLGGLFAG